MGTDGTVEITVGDDVHHAIAWWYREPPKDVSTVTKADEKKAVRGGRHHGGYRRSERTDPDHDHRPAVHGQGRASSTAKRNSPAAG